MTGFPSRLLIQAINHLLSSEPWATSRLAQFSGNIARIIFPPFHFDFSIAPNGMLDFADEQDSTPSVTITLPPDAFFKAISGDFSKGLAAAKVSGLAEFAETLSFLAKNIRWDVEADFSSVIGDIPARRGVQAIRQGFAQHQSSVKKAFENTREYLIEESRLIVSDVEIQYFSASVTELRDDLSRLEARLARL